MEMNFDTTANPMVQFAGQFVGKGATKNFRAEVIPKPSHDPHAADRDQRV